MTFQVEVRAENFKAQGALVRYAVVQTSRELREEGRQDVASMGNLGRFGNSFSTGFRAVSGGYVIDGYLKPAFLKVFQTGGVSRGKPLLWIPIAPLKIKVHKYGGRLIRPGNARVLIRPSDRKAMYVGVTSITNRKRLDLDKVAYEVGTRFVDHYGEISGTGGGGVERL